MKRYNIFEIYNEVTLLLVTTLMTPLAQDNYDADTKFNVGWGIVGLAVINLGINYLSMV